MGDSDQELAINPSSLSPDSMVSWPQGLMGHDSFGTDHGTVLPVSQSGKLWSMPEMLSPTCRWEVVSACFENVAIELRTAVKTGRSWRSGW